MIIISASASRGANLKAEVEDDGNLITYYVFDYEEVIQYDRETGIVIILMDCNMDNEASSRDYLDLGLDMVHGRI